MLTKEMKSFLADWLVWVDIGAPEHEVFEQSGLCGNFGKWSRSKGLDYTDFVSGLDSMRLTFRLEGLDTAFPFDGHSGNFLQSLVDANFTKNQLRVDWVRAHV